MTTKFADLKHKSTPAQRAEVEKRVAATLEKMALHDLRKARKADKTQGPLKQPGDESTEIAKDEA